jgi:hypothetical protein
MGGEHPKEEHEDQEPDEEHGVDERLDKTHKHVQWVRDPCGIVDHPLQLPVRHGGALDCWCSYP